MKGPMRKWSPAPPHKKTFLGAVEPNGGTDLGLSLMAIMSVAGIHSAISPSLATFSSFFSRTEQEQAIARRTLLISLGASALTSLGILLVFKRWTPALVGLAAGFGLFGLGMHAVYSEPPSVSTMEEKRAEQIEEEASSELPLQQVA